MELSKKDITTRRYQKTLKGVLTMIYAGQRTRSRIFQRELSYTLKQLHEKFLNDKNYIKLHNDWVKSEYKYWKKPSIDRIDPEKGYNLKNIQMVTWKDNRRKGDKENTIRLGRKIIMCDLDGKELKRFNAIAEAQRETRIDNISIACQGKIKQSGGYIWKYAEENIINQEVKNIEMKKVDIRKDIYKLFEELSGKPMTKEIHDKLKESIESYIELEKKLLSDAQRYVQINSAKMKEMGKIIYNRGWNAEILEKHIGFLKQLFEKDVK